MNITAISDTHFDEPTYKEFIQFINTFPDKMKQRPKVDILGHLIYDGLGHEQTQTIFEFAIDPAKKQQLVSALISKGCDVIVDGERQPK